MKTKTILAIALLVALLLTIGIPTVLNLFLGEPTSVLTPLTIGDADSAEYECMMELAETGDMLPEDIAEICQD